ncbi:glycoside hydrolase family 9 protein [Sphingomonas sabuli]|uniref:Endoglucanase n=2 Tax=Sphingomonas sabuli TaxID=2764186 RepID=A0A7G9L5Y8_9SPHN|nr:glycoside hydrolase family 9 protein [Sphingomonas sabuli]
MLVTGQAAFAQPLAVHANQVGMLPAGAKRAIVTSASKQPLPWRLLDTDGTTRASGLTSPFGADRWSGQAIHRIDFSSFTSAGPAYRLVVGEATSEPFDISAATYAPLARDALGYFYQTRAGIPIEARFAGAQWARPAGHATEAAKCLAGTDGHGNAWPGCVYSLDVRGGWYDAGDHGKYVVNGGISLWTLLNLHERNQLAGTPAQFADGRAAIPEAGNGVSDLLDEARWQLEFFFRMQVPDSTTMQLPVGAKRNQPKLKFSPVDVSGMVHHKVSDDKWTGIPLRPDQDREPRVLFPPSTAATLNFAAVTAQCARIWKTIDPAFAARCLQAAERAWAAAARNPAIHAIDEFPGSGGYGDADLADEFYWAAAELLATTGRPAYRSTVESSAFYRLATVGEPGWPAVAPLGTITLALLPGAVDPAERSRLRTAITRAADGFLGERAGVGYAIPYAPAEGYPWGSNSSLLNRAMILGLAADFTGDTKYRDGVIDAMDYVLGRNPLSRSYVTGYGEHPMANPHHRFWARAADPAFPPPPPGIVSGGPNSTSSPRRDEPVGPAKGCAPQTCWVDDYRSFTTNEVAINWNAPLLWTAAWLDQVGAGAPLGALR